MELLWFFFLKWAWYSLTKSFNFLKSLDHYHVDAYVSHGIQSVSCSIYCMLIIRVGRRLPAISLIIVIMVNCIVSIRVKWLCWWGFWCWCADAHCFLDPGMDVFRTARSLWVPIVVKPELCSIKVAIRRVFWYIFLCSLSVWETQLSCSLFAFCLWVDPSTRVSTGNFGVSS